MVEQTRYSYQSVHGLLHLLSSLFLLPHLLRNGLDELLHAGGVLEVFDVNLEILEGIQHFVTNETVGRKLQFVLPLGFLVMLSLPVFYL